MRRWAQEVSLEMDNLGVLAPLSAVAEALRAVLGDDQKDISALHMTARTVVVYAVALALVRVGEKRFLGQSSALDLIVGIMLGSIMSRAINAGAPLLPTCAAAAALVGVHWVIAVVAYRSDRAGILFKGRARQLVRDGRVLQHELAGGHIGERDLLQAARLEARVTNIADIQEAHLERNGDISVIPKSQGSGEQSSGEAQSGGGAASGPARVVEVSVERGVQTVRIRLDG